MPDHTPLQLMDRLLDALPDGNLSPREAPMWGVRNEILSQLEARRVLEAMQDTARSLGFQGIYDAWQSGWDFARFREELAKREAENA